MNEQLKITLYIVTCFLAGCWAPAKNRVQVETYVRGKTGAKCLVDPGMRGMPMEPKTVWVPYRFRDYPTAHRTDSVEHISYRSNDLDTADIHQMLGDLQRYPDQENGFAPSRILIRVIREAEIDTFEVGFNWVLHHQGSLYYVKPALRHYLLFVMPEDLRKNWEGEVFPDQPTALDFYDYQRRAAGDTVRAAGEAMFSVDSNQGRWDTVTFDP